MDLLQFSRKQKGVQKPRPKQAHCSASWQNVTQDVLWTEREGDLAAHVLRGKFSSQYFATSQPISFNIVVSYVTWSLRFSDHSFVYIDFLAKYATLIKKSYFFIHWPLEETKMLETNSHFVPLPHLLWSLKVHYHVHTSQQSATEPSPEPDGSSPCPETLFLEDLFSKNLPTFP